MFYPNLIHQLFPKFVLILIFITLLYPSDCISYNTSNGTSYNCDCTEESWKNYYSYMAGCWLPNANLKSADLKWANLEGAYLVGADLRYAQLVTANLTNANLVNANMVNSNLNWVNLENANLEF